MPPAAGRHYASHATTDFHIFQKQYTLMSRPMALHAARRFSSRQEAHDALPGATRHVDYDDDWLRLGRRRRLFRFLASALMH